MSYASLQEAMINGHGIERAFCCHVHGDTNPSASVNSLTGLWFCYACGARGKYDVSEMPMADFVASMTTLLNRAEDKLREYSESYLDVFDSMGPGKYWLSRFNEETCRAHRLGHDMVSNYATIPVRDPAGVLLGVIRRDLTGADKAKYRYPGGVVVSHLLYNLHRASDDVMILTEGATDAIAAEETGYGAGAVASYRDGVSQAQCELIRKYAPKVVVVAYDQDAAGHKGAKQVDDLLKGYVRVDRLTWDTYKDLASIPLSERTEMLKAVADMYK